MIESGQVWWRPLGDDGLNAGEHFTRDSGPCFFLVIGPAFGKKNALTKTFYSMGMTDFCHVLDLETGHTTIIRHSWLELHWELFCS